MVSAAGEAVMCQLRSKLRYQFSAPVNPVRLNSRRSKSSSASLSQSGSCDGSANRSMNPSGPWRQHAQCGGLVGRCLHAGQRSQHGPARVGRHLGVGRPGLLEVQDEEVVPEDAAERLRQRVRRPRHRRETQPGYRRHAVRMQQWRAPGDHRAQVVADQRGPFGADGIDQADQIPGQSGDVIGPTCSGREDPPQPRWSGASTR